MALKTFLDYDKREDKIIGLVDYGDENRSWHAATSVVVVMTSEILSASWSQALSYFFVKGNCKGPILKIYICEAISILQNIGLTPCHFVCDQGKNFFSILGVFFFTSFKKLPKLPN